MKDFKKKKLTDIIRTSDLGGSRVEITEWASVTMTSRRKGNYTGFLEDGSLFLLFMGDHANSDEYHLLLQSTNTGKPATIQGILQEAPGKNSLYCLRVSGVKFDNEISKGYKE